MWSKTSQDPACISSAYRKTIGPIPVQMQVSLCLYSRKFYNTCGTQPLELKFQTYILLSSTKRFVKFPLFLVIDAQATELRRTPAFSTWSPPFFFWSLRSKRPITHALFNWCRWKFSWQNVSLLQDVPESFISFHSTLSMLHHFPEDPFSSIFHGI